MAEKQPPEYGKRQTQTTPKGMEIPVPKREQVMDALAKVAKPKPKPQKG